MKLHLMKNNNNQEKLVELRKNYKQKKRFLQVILKREGNLTLNQVKQWLLMDTH